MYPGFEKSLKALKAAGKRLFVATSKPEVYARRIIEHFDLDQYFEYVAGMELDGGRGSKAEVIGYLEKAGAVYVAGTPEDIAGIILK